MPNQQIKNWQDKLIDLIEEEIVLATGDKSKKHFSGKCNMNEILDLVGKEIEQEKQKSFKDGKLNGYLDAMSEIKNRKKQFKKITVHYE